MSHQIRRFRSKAYRLLVSNDTISSIFARGYSRKTNRKVSIDPGKNTQYPYVHGDPLQEEALTGVAKENALTKFKNKDKDIDDRKKQQFEKQRISELESGLKFEKLAEGDIRLGKPQQGEALSPAKTKLPISLILDSMKDPGNVGTLIRTAAAVGCQRIITTKGSVNVWDCKVLRSAMGGHFSVPIYAGIHWSDIPNYVGSDAQVYLANAWQSSMLAGTFDERLRNEDLDEVLIDSNTSDSGRELDSDSDVEENETTDLEVEQNAHHFQNVPLPVCDYSDIILSHDSQSSAGERAVHVALVLGGETAGLSTQAKKFAYRYYGCYVSIPMDKTVNSGIAGSKYELRKKLLAVTSRGNNADSSKTVTCVAADV